MFLDYTSVYGEELSAPRPIPKLDDHTFSSVRDCLFNILIPIYSPNNNNNNNNLVLVPSSEN